MSLVLFATVIDWVMKNALTGLDVGLEWINNSKLCDLDYADDIVLATIYLFSLRKLVHSYGLVAL